MIARMSSAQDAWPDAWPGDEDPDQAPGPGEGPAGEPTLTVPQLGERLTRLLDQAFPRPFWLVGEASGLSRAQGGRAGHWYFSLVDDQAEGARRASVDVIMWRGTVSRLFGPRGRLRRDLDPADGVVLRVLVKPNYYAPRGQVSFVIEDVDPEFTMGSLDRERREVLARLTADGSTERNGALPLEPVPLSLGLVTSEGSAAHHDVLETLEGAGIGFSIVFCDARTQGPDTTPSVRAALADLGRRDLDAILLVRGGGSRLDLSWFDKEPVARAIAACPVPVLTGIGHEIDSSVADAVAHTAFKTPTAAAEFVVASAREARQASEETWQRLLDLSARSLRTGDEQLTASARALVQVTRAGLVDGAAHLERTSRRVAALAEASLTAAQEGLARARSRLATGSHITRLARLEQDLAVDGRLLAERARRSLDARAAELEAAEQRARLLDPVRTLARGYAMLRRADGSLLLDAAAVRPGERLEAQLRDGRLPLRHLDDESAP